MVQLTRQFALFKQTILNDTRSFGIQLLRFIFAFLLALVVYIAQSETSRWREIDGLVIFQWVFALNLVYSAFAGLFLFLPIVKEEREEDTLGMIMMTGISPFAYLLGKIGSRLFMFTLLLSVQIPIIYLCVTLGGIDLTTILLAYILLLFITFHLANIFLLGSLLSTSLFTGVIISGGLWFILCYLFAVSVDFFGLYHGSGNPFLGLEKTLKYIFENGTLKHYRTITLAYLTFLILTGVFFFLISVYYFDTLSGEHKEVELPKKLKGKHSSEDKAEKLQGFSFFIILRKLLTKRFGKRPIIYKDFRFTSYGPLLYLSQLGLLLLIFSDHLYLLRLNYNEELYNIFRFSRESISSVFLLCASSLLISSNLIFASEIKNKTLNALILLPQQCHSLYFQKLFTILKVNLPSLITLTVLCTCYTFIPIDYYKEQLTALIIFTTIISGLFINIFLSITLKKYSFFLSSGLTLGWFFLHLVFYELIRIPEETACFFFLLEGIIISLLLIKLSISSLKKHSLTS